MNQIKENKNLFEASFKTMWHEIKTWSYLEFKKREIEIERFQNDVFRSSHQRYSVKIGELKNFVNFTRKHLCWSLFLTKLQASGPPLFGLT